MVSFLCSVQLELYRLYSFLYSSKTYTNGHYYFKK